MTLMRLLTTAACALSAVPALCVTFQFNTVHSSAAGLNPFGPGPWATLDFVQNGADRIDFTLTNNTSVESGQFLRNLYLNIDPFVAVTSSLIGGDTGSVQSIQISNNGHGHATASNFDVKVNLNPGGNRLTGGEFVSWSLVGTGLTTDNISVFSGGSSPARAMIHLQGIPGGQSSHITPDAVPEPATLAVLAGLPALAAFRRRRR